MLLYPVLPILGWGPLTHAYINNRILKHLDNSLKTEGNDATRKLLETGNRDYFIICAVYPDIIKARGFLKGDMSYDYAHNPLPNRYYGQPEFSNILYKNLIKTEDSELTAFALSWRAHQVADVFAHHMPIRHCWGFANSENFFGPFWGEVLHHLEEENVGELPGAFYKADHWMTELIVDLFCYISEGYDWSRKYLRDAPVKPLDHLPSISRQYISENKPMLESEYLEILPIETKEIKRGKQFSDTLNHASLIYFDSLIKKRSLQTLTKMIRSHGSFGNLEAILDNTAYIAAKSLLKPQDKWNAPRFDINLFLNSADSFEKTFPGVISEPEYHNYYSEKLEQEYKKYQLKREGIVRLVLEKTPLDPIRWFIDKTSLITGSNFINRKLLPSGWTSYALSLRYAFNIRERKEEDFVIILRRTLEEAGIIART